MSYTFKKGAMYRMPTHFGPSLGPRQGPNDERFACRENPAGMAYSVSFLTKRDQLQDLCPPGFEVEGEPVVTVTQTYLKEIEWLAGRGYNLLGVTFPAAFNGEHDRAVGPFLTVLWENLADAIISGREDLGFSKVYADLPDPVVVRGVTHLSANWQGFRFMDMKLTKIEELDPSDFPSPEVLRTDGVLTGTLHYKYLPTTGAWGETDVAYAVLTPSATPNRIVKAMWRAEGSVEFHQATWEEMPTQFVIPNTFRALEVEEYRGATITKTVGGKDLRDQRILR